MERIGGLIRQARMERGLTQRELAKRLHVTDKAVSKWERDICRPDVELLEPLARELDIPLLRLLGVEKEPEQGGVGPAGELRGGGAQPDRSTEGGASCCWRAGSGWFPPATAFPRRRRHGDSCFSAMEQRTWCCGRGCMTVTCSSLTRERHTA